MSLGYPIPWWALLLALVALALVAHATYAGTVGRLSRRQRWTLIVLRSTVLVLVGAFLLRPLVRLPPQGRDAVVAVLVDVSPSMSIRDAGGASRLERAARIYRDQVLPALAGRYDVELLGFSDRVAPSRPESLAVTGRRTELAAALRAVRQRYGTGGAARSVAGIVLLSDGGDTGVDEPARAGAGGPPVFAIGVGADALRDREVLSMAASEAGVTDSAVSLTVSTVSRGFGRTPYDVRLVSNGSEIGRRKVTPAGDGIPTQTVFSIPPEASSAAVYSVEVAPSGGDDVPGNDRGAILVGPAARPRRVLFVQGAPGFEHTFLLRTWGQDAGLKVDAVARKGRNDQGQDVFLVQAPAERSGALTSGYPRTRDALFAYDAIVFANEDWERLTLEQKRLTADFVSRRGGGLLVLGAESFKARGLAGSPIEDLLPISPEPGAGGVSLTSTGTAGEPGPAAAARAGDGVDVTGGDRAPFKAALTEEGRDHPITRLAEAPEDNERRWAALPALSDVARLGGSRPGASVLAVARGGGQTGSRPLLAVQRFGRGRTLVFGGEASWRWKMQMPASDGSYDLFWRQALRWIATAAPDPVAIEPVEHLQPGDTVPVAINVADARFDPEAAATVAVEATSPSGAVEMQKARLADGAAGTFRASLTFDERGVYRVRVHARHGATDLGGAERSLLVGGLDSEFTDPRMNTELLRRVAAASGGEYLPAAEVAGLPRRLARAARSSVERVRDAWHNPLTFALVVALLAVEWVLRRRWGLA